MPPRTPRPTAPEFPPDYALDQSIRDQLQLKAFEGKFEVKDLVGSISEKLIAHSKAEAGRK